MPGRGLGCCAENDQPGYKADAVPQRSGRGFRNSAGRGPGFGCSHGRGRGMGYGRAAGRGRGAHHASAAENERKDFDSQESREREITRLENIANTLASELEIVKNKIQELKNN